MLRPAAFAAALALVAPAPAPAQTAEPSQTEILETYVGSQMYRDYLEKLFNLGEPPPLKRECPPLTLLENKYQILEAPTFVHDGLNYHIETGSWIALGVLRRCNERVVRRVLLKAQPGTNAFEARLLLPGDFRGNPQLESETLHLVMPNLMAKAQCTDRRETFILDVKALDPPGPDGWSERWRVEACGTPVSARVSYAKAVTGLNISVTEIEAR